MGQISPNAVVGWKSSFVLCRRIADVCELAATCLTRGYRSETGKKQRANSRGGSNPQFPTSHAIEGRRVDHCSTGTFRQNHVTCILGGSCTNIYSQSRIDIDRGAKGIRRSALVLWTDGWTVTLSCTARQDTSLCSLHARPSLVLVSVAPTRAISYTTIQCTAWRDPESADVLVDHRPAASIFSRGCHHISIALRTYIGLEKGQARAADLRHI